MSVETATQAVTSSMGAGASLMSLMPMVIIFVIFYFFLIRPQLKRQRQVEEMISNLKKGDKVVAAGGIYGLINKIDGEMVLLEVAEGIKISVTKSSVTETKSLEKKADKEKHAEPEKKNSDEKLENVKKSKATPAKNSK